MRIRNVARGLRALVWAMDDVAEDAVQAEKPLNFSYGGQAVIEGVMMRGQYVAAVAVRKPRYRLQTDGVTERDADGRLSGPYLATVPGKTWRGQPVERSVVVDGVRITGRYKGELARDPLWGQGGIEVKEVPLNKALYRGRIARLPFVRGLVLLWDALGLGTRALMWSADVALEEEEDIDFSFDSAAGAGLVLFSLTMGIGLFFVLPAAASAGFAALTGIESRFTADAVEGVIKLALFIGYIWAIGFMPDIKRLFGYHGAEHKTINAYEAGADLTPEEVDRHSIQHPRCGTAFLLTLVFLSVVIHMITGRPENIFLLMLSRVGLIFPIAGIAYEVIRFTAKNLENPLVQLIIKPNLALQNLTTRPPDKTMLEVGIVSLERVLAAEKAGAGVEDVTPAEAAVASGD
ncbi:MAG: DUF1385 domain-containing protein [Chloroflexi bacterium]|nr:DUF1385 domain-containing protein [Chloroflexota bacterium]